jgi:hypothetical protein
MEAIGVAQEAMQLARARHDGSMVTRLEKMLTEFQGNHPYREESFSQ